MTGGAGSAIVGRDRERKEERASEGIVAHFQRAAQRIRLTIGPGKGGRSTQIEPADQVGCASSVEDLINGKPYPEPYVAAVRELDSRCTIDIRTYVLYTLAHTHPHCRHYSSPANELFGERMSVLCCNVPNLLITLACRQSPSWAGRPLALLGPAERVWAASPEAGQYGVQTQMRPQQAQIACPDLLLRPLDLTTAEAEQSALLAELAEWQLPVEPQSWGSAYVDMHAVAKNAPAVQPLAAEVGRRLRKRLGLDLQPSVGWDSGKFTARAAACVAAPGRMRLVDKVDEPRFLNPLPITLLPLPRPHQQQLHWLGIRTLGQFAALPAAGVLQRFGAGGRQAQRWAQGRDDRRVRAAVSVPPAPTVVTLDTPVATLQPVVDALMASLRPLLAKCAARLEGMRRLRIAVCFTAGAERAGRSRLPATAMAEMGGGYRSGW
jgi:nucleotidyltransferase/DNA polymerase involved in DNA repair